VDESDVAIKVAGAGGDGAQTAALVLARAAINEGFDSTHIPSYGPESRGGTSYADVHLAVEEVMNPASPEPHVLVAFNAPSLAKFGPLVRENGIVVYDSSVVTDEPEFRDGVRKYPVPLAQIATELGKTVVKNMVALGALQGACDLLTEESILTVVREAVASKPGAVELNEKAFRRGMEFVANGR
jgi:Pyruvate/2-oxoacid:ferredoxin oxidoreductase gamma subunit